MVSLKITKLGTSLAVVLPPEVLASMRVTEGDTLYLTETSAGYQISPNDPELEEQLRLGREIMERDRDFLRALSKS